MCIRDSLLTFSGCIVNDIIEKIYHNINHWAAKQYTKDYLDVYKRQTHKKEVLTMSVSEFADKIKDAMPELDFGTITKKNIKVKTRSEGGRAAQVQVGDQKVSGTDIRSALSLYSTRMEFSFKDDEITITTSGSGHGVGMSQYGANGLAKKGKDYREILAHYYPVSYTHLDVYKRQV